MDSIYKLSDEIDENGNKFIISSNGSIEFGIIPENSGLNAAPIRLSLGENKKGKDGKFHGYGLLHIEAGHGEEIRKAGFNCIEQFIEEVARNYHIIREGAKIGLIQTYLLEVSKEHNHTMFISLSKDGSYWNVNSAGIFREKYSRCKRKIYTVPALGRDTYTDTPEVNSGLINGATAPAGNSSKISL